MISPSATRAILVCALIASAPLAAGPLHEAARNGDTAEVDRLLKAGADISAFDEADLTPLIVAALAGQPGAVAVLIENGADPGGRDRKGFTPLHAAAHEGHHDVVLLLLKHDVDVNDQDNWVKLTALHAAAERDYQGIAETLITQGADVNLEERNGWTPVMRATFKSHEDMVRLLREHGARCSAAAGQVFLDYCMDPGV